MSARTRKRLVVGVVALLTVGIFTVVGLAVARSGGGEATAAADADVPTWYSDVQPIVQENCVQCHQPEGKNLGGMVAPFSQTSYEEARPYARLMALMVEEERMPPWHAHRVHKGTFVGEIYLTEEEKNTIIAWGEGGAPAGDPADAQPYAGKEEESESIGRPGEWWIGEPDLVIGFEEPYWVGDDIEDLNVGVNAQVPDDYTEPRWIKASEIRAGSDHVHHTCGEPFGCIAPGWDPYVYPDGFAKLLPPVEEVRLGMHYNKEPGEGTGFYDSTQAAMIFYEKGDTIRHFVHRSVLSVGEDFVIPAGHPAYSITHEFEFEEDTYILSLTPHMHYLGKSAKYELQYPDGHRELLLWVPEYRFEWQRMYVFKDPPVAPAGSTLLWTPTWDNSEFNPANPDPDSPTPYGLPTTAEMGNGWLDYTPVEPLNHVVGEDPVPEDLLQEVTEQLEERAARSGRRFIDGELVEEGEVVEPPPEAREGAGEADSGDEER